MKLFKTTKRFNFYQNRNNNISKNEIMKRSSSYVTPKGENPDQIAKINKEQKTMKNKTLKTFNKTNYTNLSNRKLKNNSSLPLLNTNYPERMNNYSKMKNYKIKLKKITKTKSTDDHLLQLLHEYGLHYSFSLHKYAVGDKSEYYTKFLPRKFQINYKASNLKKSVYSNNISPNKNNNQLQNSKLKSDNNKKEGKQTGIYYSTTEEDDDDRMSYKKYMKLQSIAEIRFRPMLGDSSYDLVNYIKKIDGIRKGVVNNLIKQINNVENRYNNEKPKEDSKFITKMQWLYHHKWKNLFSLKDYQELFKGNLKGKISNQNYEIMEKNFSNIFKLCFSKGNIYLDKIQEYQ